MKQENGKKSKKWIWLVAGLAAVLVILGVALAFLLPGQQAEEPAKSAGLYWNVDKDFYTENSETGLSTRQPGEDGMFHLRFAFEGELLELTCADRQLLNYIDTMNVMGLVFDTDGMIVDAVDPKTVATEIAASFYVSDYDDSSVTVNSSVAMNGMNQTLKVTDKTGIYLVDPTAENPGERTRFQIMDEVYIYGDESGNATHIFISERMPDAEVYWRVERLYDAQRGVTTRVPDENGVYTLQFAHDGAQVELKCRDKDIVNAIDSTSELYGDFAFLFDEEGYIIESLETARVLKAKSLCTDGYVTAIDGDTVTLTGAAGGIQGNTFTFTMQDTCDTFLVCTGCHESHIGERTDHVRLEDRVKVFTDMDNAAVLIFVMRRSVDSPMYYVLNQKYNWKTMETSRVPDANGYYVYEMLADGKPVTLRTKDKAIANEIDYRYDQCMGLKVNGDVIEKFYNPRCVAGNYSPGYNRYVTGLSSPVATITSASDFGTFQTAVMSADCKIYDVTGYHGVEKGSKATLRLYDRVTTWLNVNGEIEYIFITERYVENADVYYNVGQKYSGTTKETTREPDENGYYVFTMIKDGKEVSVKTKNKKLASYIDSQYAPVVSLVVSGGVVKEAYPATAAVKYGKKVTNTHYVNSVAKDGSFTTYYIVNGVRTDPETVWKLADDCKIYNVSSGYSKYRGEKTALKPDDQIQSIATNPDGEVVMIFVMGRKFDSPLYWNLDRQYNTTKKETTREPNAEGWYVFDLAVNGTVKQFKTKDKAVASEVDRWSVAFAMVTDGDIILRAMTPTLAKGIYADAASGFDVMKQSGKTLSLARNHPTAANHGETKEVALADKYAVYDVSPYAQNRGAAAKLELGDRVQMYSDAYGNVVACFITYKNTHEEGHISYCEHCGKDVFWNPWVSDPGNVDAHFYLTHDYEAPWQPSVGSADKPLDMVLDLNGHTMTAKKRAFAVSGTLSIVDSVGGGAIRALTDTGDTLINGGCIMIAGGTLNLYDGTLTTAAAATTPNLGGVVYISGEKAVFNMYGGAVTGGAAAQRGGNIYSYSGTFNMHGGSVDGDVEIYGKSTVNLSGAPVISGTGIKLATGNLLTLGELSKDTDVVIDADGIFTNETKNAAAYAPYFTAAAEGAKVVVDGKVLRCTIPGGLVLDANGYGLCEHCGESVKWTAADPNGLSSKKDGQHHHLYLGQDVNITWGYLTLQENTTICLHLNGKTLKQGSRIFVYGNSTLNIMGEGTVTSAATGSNSTGTVTVNQGVLNVYGGTYQSASETAPAIALTGASAKVNMLGGTVENGMDANKGVLSLSGNAAADSIYVDDDAVLSVKADYTGTAIVSFESITENPVTNGESTGIYTGTLTLAGDGNYSIIAQEGKLAIPGYVISGGESGGDEGGDEEEDPPAPGKIVLDANGYAMCDHCGESVKWTAADPNGLATKNDGAHHHLYLGKNVDINWGYLVLNNETTLCLHLNGKTLKQASRIFVYGGSTLNIMGDGTVLSTGTGSNSTGTVTASIGTVNIYGGTYQSTAANGAPAVAVVGTNAAVNLLGGTVENGVNVDKGVLTLAAAATADSIRVAAEGKLTVKADWTGTASVSFASLANGEIPAANGESQGEYTGTLTLAAEGTPPISGKDGRLVVDYSEAAKGKLIATAANSMVFPATGSSCTAVCPIHGEVTWQAKNTGLSEVKDGQIHHYYLTKDFAYTWGYGTVTTDTEVCLHLNGHTISQGTRIYVSGTESVLNIMGSGMVLGAGTSTNNTNKTGTLTVHSGTVNLYGGTYRSAAVVNDAGVPVILAQTENATVNVYADVVIDGSYDSDGNGEADLYVPGVKLVGAAFNMYGGTLKNGSAASGGNIFASNAEVNLYEAAVVSGGKATTQGGNIHLADGSVLTTCGTVTGGQTTGSAAHGGNISMVSNCRVIIAGGTISGGIANGQGGNLRAYNATVVMTGGEISGGDSLVNVNDNVWLAGSSAMTMTGGTVKGTNGTESSGTAIDLAGTAVLTLGGDACVIRDDGVSRGNIRLSSTTNKLQILNDWTGTASVKFRDPLSYGAAVTAAQCGSLGEDVFTPGGSYQGSLTNEYGDPAKILGTDGALALEAAPEAE